MHKLSREREECWKRFYESIDRAGRSSYNYQYQLLDWDSHKRAKKIEKDFNRLRMQYNIPCWKWKSGFIPVEKVQDNEKDSRKKEVAEVQTKAS